MTFTISWESGDGYHCTRSLCTFVSDIPPQARPVHHKDKALMESLLGFFLFDLLPWNVLKHSAPRCIYTKETDKPVEHGYRGALSGSGYKVHVTLERIHGCEGISYHVSLTKQRTPELTITHDLVGLEGTMLRRWLTDRIIPMHDVDATPSWCIMWRSVFSTLVSACPVCPAIPSLPCIHAWPWTEYRSRILTLLRGDGASYWGEHEAERPRWEVSWLKDIFTSGYCPDDVHLPFQEWWLPMQCRLELCNPFVSAIKALRDGRSNLTKRSTLKPPPGLNPKPGGPTDSRAVERIRKGKEYTIRQTEWAHKTVERTLITAQLGLESHLRILQCNLRPMVTSRLCDEIDSIESVLLTKPEALKLWASEPGTWVAPPSLLDEAVVEAFYCPKVGPLGEPWHLVDASSPQYYTRYAPPEQPPVAQDAEVAEVVEVPLDPAQVETERVRVASEGTSKSLSSLSTDELGFSSHAKSTPPDSRANLPPLVPEISTHNVPLDTNLSSSGLECDAALDTSPTGTSLRAPVSISGVPGIVPPVQSPESQSNSSDASHNMWSTVSIASSYTKLSDEPSITAPSEDVPHGHSNLSKRNPEADLLASKSPWDDVPNPFAQLLSELGIPSLKDLRQSRSELSKRNPGSHLPVPEVRRETTANRSSIPRPRSIRYSPNSRGPRLGLQAAGLLPTPSRSDNASDASVTDKQASTRSIPASRGPQSERQGAGDLRASPRKLPAPISPRKLPKPPASSRKLPERPSSPQKLPASPVSAQKPPKPPTAPAENPAPDPSNTTPPKPATQSLNPDAHLTRAKIRAFFASLDLENAIFPAVDLYGPGIYARAVSSSTDVSEEKRQRRDKIVSFLNRLPSPTLEQHAEDVKDMFRCWGVELVHRESIQGSDTTHEEDVLMADEVNVEQEANSGTRSASSSTVTPSSSTLNIRAHEDIPQGVITPKPPGSYPTLTPKKRRLNGIWTEAPDSAVELSDDPEDFEDEEEAASAADMDETEAEADKENQSEAEGQTEAFSPYKGPTIPSVLISPPADPGYAGDTEASSADEDRTAGKLRDWRSQSQSRGKRRMSGLGRKGRGSGSGSGGSAKVWKGLEASVWRS
ncbi:hypothetical protein M011DRAFT_263484 [Sporormia fimetaria CBS 119925]|uniref:Uncharacterized protein n=1 Tax=Sporormia fimetaria CBS 119925 TaxID=1340428 RepID=A0A6A6UXZ8_9PLEO|nr:hypothetical protein M011DRAFT_263484 [Sporormia fimetaria CBS 119925]